MAVFALVHGGAHGGWCWEEVIPRLEARGHLAVAPDLPFGADDGVAAWADTVVEALGDLASGADDVVVVGHSLGGLGVPVIGQRVAASHMVFVGAMVPVPGRSYTEVLADEPDALLIDGVDDAVAGDASALQELADDPDPDAEGGVSWAFAREHFYADLDEVVARRAWKRLRPQGFTMFVEACPLERWPDIASTYVVMTGDRSVNPAWSRRIARGRLGAMLVELPGGHSPFYGRPDELVDVLDSVATPHR
jgi:pimeloyl-ACP methyl ester carboxylesterase